MLLLVNIILYGCIGNQKKPADGQNLTGTEFRRKTSDGQYYTISKISGSENLYITTKEFSGVIFSESVSRYGDKNSKRFAPTAKEIFKAEQVFEECLKSGKTDSYGMVMSLDRIYAPSGYYRQYFGCYNKKGQKLIYLNCFIKGAVKTDHSWEKNEYVVMDGGKNFFNVLINMEMQECSLFMVQGRA